MLGGLTSIGGAMQQSQTGDASGLVAGGGIGFVGLMLAVAAVVWWVWGMIDAKRLCEQFNANVASQGAMTCPTGCA